MAEKDWNPTMCGGTEPGLSLDCAINVADHMLREYGPTTSKYNADALIVLRAALKKAQEDRWPEKLTPELRDALGEMIFNTGPVARAYRDAGFDIPSKVEGEQAFMLHKFAGLALQHGAGWRKAFALEFDKVIAKAKERAAAA